MFQYPFPKNPGNTQRFLAQGVTVWQPYVVPIGANFLEILAFGAGGAGGNGFTAAAAAARGGGAGGGSGAVTRLLIPTTFLLPTLWCQVGLGGVSVGGDSYVALDRSTIAQTMLARATGGGLGGNGSGASSGGAAAAAVATTLANQGPFTALGQYASLAGQTGVAGGSQVGANGVTISYGIAGMFACGGAGGAGTTSADFVGGGITGGGFCPTLSGGNGSGAGQVGFTLFSPYTFSGGTGGGASNAGLGGNGGQGAIGSGGGGGGGGTTGGTGGQGGGGLILITAIY